MLHYLDPPYWETEGYRVDFPFAEYERMADRMRSAQGRAVLSINDHTEIPRVFDGMTQILLQIHYTVGRTGASRRPAS
ncbi:MAG TPA: hypothetical protein VEY92_06895 [Pseudoxanthomonas sp.]|nr:hypothetical protein [Pseudoxanthomonas sp.]